MMGITPDICQIGKLAQGATRMVTTVTRPQKPALILPNVSRAKDMTAQEHIYQRLRKAIMLGRIAPGVPVTIRGLAAMLDTSPTPVREALRRLSSENGLTLVPNRRIIVPNLTPERFSELILLRVNLETHAAQRALPHISDFMIDELAEIDGRIEAAIDAGDRDAQIIENQRFHRGIYCANPHPVAMPMIESIWLQLGAFNRIAARYVKELYKVDRHAQALAALRARDAAALAAAIEADIRDAVGDLSKPALKAILGEGPDFEVGRSSPRPP
jgi:DNA-binding GntR family transcriptional regulator